MSKPYYGYNNSFGFEGFGIKDNAPMLFATEEEYEEYLEDMSKPTDNELELSTTGARY